MSEAQRRRTARLAGQAGVAVLVLLLAALLALPLIALVVEVPLRRVPKLVQEPVVTDAVRVTLETNLIATAVVLLLGTPTAYLLARSRFRGRSIVITLIEVPLVLPPAVAGIGLLAAFGAEGLFGGTLADGGIMLPFTKWAVVLAVAFISAPFYLRQAIASFEAVDPDLVDAARTLGVRPFTAFRRIVLPLAAGGLLAGWSLAFARGIGEFGATIMFAGNVRDDTQTLSLATYEQLDSDFDIALAIGLILLVLSAAILLCAKLLATWNSSSSTSRSRFAPSTSMSS